MNNRQAGRRRGRGGQRSQGGGNPNQRDNGNRIDNRARGNAAQLLEKYRNLARDAQMQGDRVNTEYYLQFADHYFRVLSESRSRFEEQNQRRRDEFDGDDDDGFEFDGASARDDRDDRDDRGNHNDRGNREERAARDDRGPRPDRDLAERPARRDDRAAARFNGPANDAEDAGDAPAPRSFEPQPGNEGEAERAPRRRGRPRRDAAEAGGEAGFDVAILPPSIAPVVVDGDAGDAVDEAVKPRRRRRAAAIEEAGEIDSAA